MERLQHARVACVGAGHLAGLEHLLFEAHAVPRMHHLPLRRFLGVGIAAGETVSSIEIRGGRVSGVRTSLGRREADWVIAAAGGATPAITATVGLDLPIADPAALLVVTQPHERCYAASS